MIRIDYGEPVLRPEEVTGLKPEDLDEFYAAAPDSEKASPFFVLLASCRHFESLGDRERAARLCFLLAYYLFTPLTPPASMELALYYIRRALELDPREEYRQWLGLMEKGN